jgi:hypothetical protein
MTGVRGAARNPDLRHLNRNPVAARGSPVHCKCEQAINVQKHHMRAFPMRIKMTIGNRLGTAPSGYEIRLCQSWQPTWAWTPSYIRGGLGCVGIEASSSHFCLLRRNRSELASTAESRFISGDIRKVWTGLPESFRYRARNVSSPGQYGEETRRTLMVDATRIYD